MSQKTAREQHIDRSNVLRGCAATAEALADELKKYDGPCELAALQAAEVAREWMAAADIEKRSATQ